MQISQATENELGLLITGLRAIHVSDQAELRLRLAAQLETELATRYGTMIGSAAEQERNKLPAPRPVGRPRNTEQEQA